MAVKNYTVAASADDAMETSGTVELATSSLNINTSARHGGLSFATSGDAIAQGTTIASAILTITLAGAWEANHTWKGHKITNSGQFTTATNNISDRYTGAPTTASVTDTGSSASGGTRNIDVTTIIQELVNQAGWTSSSRIALMCKLVGTISGAFSIRTYDYGSGLATLAVTTSSGATPRVARVRLSTKVGGLLCCI